MKVTAIAMASKELEAGATPSEEKLTPMIHFNEESGKAGILHVIEHPHPSSKGVRVRFPEGTVIDGPFAETKEMIGGF